MKVFLVFVLVAGLLTHSATAKGQKAINKQNPLELSIIADKRRYKATEQLRFNVLLMNSGKEDVYILVILRASSFIFGMRQERRFNRSSTILRLLLPMTQAHL
jgi:hypothetical protein